MTVSRTYFGTYYDFGVDKERHQALVTVAIPLCDGGAALDELTAWYQGIATAPIAVTMMVGHPVQALQACLERAGSAQES